MSITKKVSKRWVVKVVTNAGRRLGRSSKLERYRRFDSKKKADEFVKYIKVREFSRYLNVSVLLFDRNILDSAWDKVGGRFKRSY